MLDDLGFPSGCLPLRKSTTTVPPVLYQQRAASTLNLPHPHHSNHHYLLSKSDIFPNPFPPKKFQMKISAFPAKNADPEPTQY